MSLCFACSSAGGNLDLAERKRKLDLILQELEIEVSTRADLMRNHCAQVVATLRNKFKTQMMSLPKKARAMTLQEFAETYGVGVEGDIMTQMRTRLAAEGWAEPSMAAPAAASASSRSAKSRQQPTAGVRSSARKAARKESVRPAPLGEQVSTPLGNTSSRRTAPQPQQAAWR